MGDHARRREDGRRSCSREALLSPGSQQDDTVIPRDTVSAGEAAYSRETLLTPLTPGAEGDDVVTVRDTASTNDDAYSRETLLNPLTPGSQQDDDVTVRYTSSHDKPSLTKRPVFLCWSRPRVRKRSTSDGYKESEKPSARVPAMKLRYHRLKLWLVLIYTVATCFSWTVTCMLCYRPVRLGSYEGQGSYTKKQYEDNTWWTAMARATNSILSALTIPVTSAICSKAAVAYCQTPPSANVKGLTMRQTLASADNGWSDFRTLTRMLRPRKGRRVRSRLLVFSALLCALGKTFDLTCQLVCANFSPLRHHNTRSTGVFDRHCACEDHNQRRSQCTICEGNWVGSNTSTTRLQA